MSTTAGMAVGALTANTWPARHARANATEKLGVAVIGCGGMGGSHVSTLSKENLSVDLMYLCDADPRQSEKRAKVVEENQKPKPQLVTDYRRVLDDPHVHAVAVATPHHWHAPIALAAMQAGKDVYIEKPASHVFHEGRVLVDAAKKYNRVVQHGTQMRSSAVTVEAGEVLKSGILGDIKMSKAWNCQNRGPRVPVSDSEVPVGVDYDRWLGPAKQRPFNTLRFHGTWRQFREYGNGDFGDDGAHDIDMARWGLGVETHPIRITGHGSNVLPAGYSEYPDNMTVTYEYADGRVLVYEDRLFTPYGQLGVDSGNAFYGTEGYMIFSRRGFFRTYLGRKEEPGPASGKSGRVGIPVPTHWESFLNGVRTRTQPTAGVEVAHLSCGLIHLGEIAARTRTVLEFDPEAEKITNHPAAHDMLTKEYRTPYGFPTAI